MTKASRKWPAFRFTGNRLGHRIAAVLFLSLLAIEAAIFVPSYLDKEQTLLAQIEARARAALQGVATGGDDDFAGEIGERRAGLIAHTPLRGLIVYNASDAVVAVLGESVESRPSEFLSSEQRTLTRTSNGKRFDYVWTPDDLNAPFMVAGRLDSSGVSAELARYTYTAAALVLLIAVVVTATLIVVLNKVVLTPVLALHHAIRGAQTDISKADEWTIRETADGEIGELILTVNQILKQASESFRIIQRRNAALMKEATARRRAEENARLAHLRLVEAVEAFPGGFAVFDNDDRLMLCNQTFRDFYPDIKDVIEPGIQFEQLLQADVAADHLRGYFRRDDTWIENRLAQHRSGNSDIERGLSSGRWMRITERHTEEGGILGVFSDISELKQREEELRASEARFRSVAESTNDALVVTTLDGDVVFWNGAAERLTGRSAEEIAGKPMARIILDERLSAYQERYHLIRSGRAEEVTGRIFESEIKAKTGETIPVEISFSVWSDGDTTYVTRTLRNIRERQKARAERQQLQTQLFQAQKNEALGTLAGGIAHDFNNLLAIILGNAQLLADDIGPGAPGREELDAVLGAGDRAKNVVKQILSFARQDPGRCEPVDLCDVVDETLLLLRATLPKTIEIDCHRPDTSSVWGDPTQMHQILMNLCINGRDAIGEAAGKLVIELGEASGPQKDWPRVALDGTNMDRPETQFVSRSDGSQHFLWMGIPPDGKHIRLSVTDTGKGIDRETLERIFDPFFTTKDTGKGTGLGLAAVQGLVFAHGGALYVETTMGEGTRFEIRLPRNESISQSQIDIEAVEGHVGGRVLVIDDEQQFVSLMRKMLERRGYDVEGVANSKAALDMIEEAPDQWDIIITDINMPEVSGLEIARKVHSIRPDLPVLLCTGSLDLISEEAMSGHHSRAILSKPVQFAELDRVLQSFLQGNIVVGET